MPNNITLTPKEKIRNQYSTKSAVRDFPDYVYIQLDNLIEEYRSIKNVKRKKEIEKEMEKIHNKHQLILFDQNKHLAVLKYLNDESLGSYAVEIANDLMKELNCKTTSEISLCQMASMSYCRYLKFSGRSIKYTSIDSVNNDTNVFYMQLNKEADRALKQYLSIVEKLKSWKQPRLKVNIKTENAYIAEKQQLNNYQNGHRE